VYLPSLSILRNTADIDGLLVRVCDDDARKPRQEDDQHKSSPDQKESSPDQATAAALRKANSRSRTRVVRT
jgi:hypothetical protein